MELNNFKQLLLKKAADNSALKAVIDIAEDDLLIEKVLESLEKMAKPSAAMGRNANAGVTAFGNQIKNKDVEMMRDALAHHINHYRAALKSGNRQVADQHLEKIIPMMHLAGKAASHSNNQLALDYIPLEPWETNYTTTERRPETGKLKEGTKGLGRRLNSVSRDVNPRSVPDYRYLEMQPHEEHADTSKSPHKGGYPFEEIQLGNPSKVDAKEAYLHLHDVAPQEHFTPHPFDEHPVHHVSEKKQDSLTPDKLEDFAQKMQDWHHSEHNARWMDNMRQSHQADPEGFKSRGKAKPSHHFDGIELLKQPHAVERPTSAASATPQIESQAPSKSIDTSNLPPALRAKFGGK